VRQTGALASGSAAPDAEGSASRRDPARPDAAELP